MKTTLVLALLTLAPVASALAMNGDRDPAQVIAYQCGLCHGKPGIADAPKIGDRRAWEARAARGLEALVQSAVKGKGGMPPRGGLGDLTEVELRQAIELMILRSR